LLCKIWNKNKRKENPTLTTIENLARTAALHFGSQITNNLNRRVACSGAIYGNFLKIGSEEISYN
jgi:translation initiation factor 1 (eIF-1/SUI1)